MKLLAITNNPERASFRQRFAVYVDFLRSEGIDVTIARLPSGIFSRIGLFKTASQYDAVFLHKKCLNAIDAFVLRKYSSKIIFNYDDAIMFSDKRPDSYSRCHMVPFLRTVKLADMVLVGSANLAEYSNGLSDNIEILPLGLNCNDYIAADHSCVDGKVRICWIGSTSTKGYLDIVKESLEDIGARYDNVVFRMICDDFIDLENMPVEKCKWTVSTRAGDIAGCDIGIAPLPDNRFTRGKCSFKVLEYSCSSLPVVASPVGTNPVHVVDGITGFLADNRQEWTSMLEKLIEGAQLRKEMGRRGIEHARKYDIDVIGKRFAESINGMCQNTS